LRRFLARAGAQEAERAGAAAAEAAEEAVERTAMERVEAIGGTQPFFFMQKGRAVIHPEARAGHLRAQPTRGPEGQAWADDVPALVSPPGIRPFQPIQKKAAEASPIKKQ